MTETVKIVRLSTGEEILCTVDDTGHELILHNPMYVLPDSITEFMPYTKSKTVRVNPNCVMFILDAVDPLAEQYHAHNSTIVTPNKQIITG